MAISIKEFVEKLTAGGGIPSPAACMEYGLQQGWLEISDIANREHPLLRKHAARIIHNFLRLEWKETDEIDASPAYVLQDLFDCRVCAGHIIQVYGKGIMDGVALPDGRLVFAAEEEVSAKEAEEIVNRISEPEKRKKKDSSVQNLCKEPREITPEEMEQFCRENRNVLLVDVRSVREYEEGHPEGAVNVPLLSIIKNPFVFHENRETTILLYCTEGYQSKAAAQCLLEAGYENVAFFAWKFLKHGKEE